jgi:hypothetical protein
MALATIGTSVPVSSQDQNRVKAIPTAKEIVELSQKAVGGDAYFNVKPYVTSYTRIKMDGGSLMTIEITESYKNKKLHLNTKLSKGILKGSGTIISDATKNEIWESFSFLISGKFKKREGTETGIIPAHGRWSNLTFETPVVVTENDVECYRLVGKYDDPKWTDWTFVCLVGVNDYYVYKTEQNNNAIKYSSTGIFSNHTKTHGIVIPKQITRITQWREKGKVMKEEFTDTIKDFTFKNDIPDSLFVVPK